MTFRHLAPAGALLLGLLAGPVAHADTFSTKNGTFAADNSVYVYSFNTPTASTYTFTTTSYAAGGFLPDLTLFQSNGNFVDFTQNSGLGDVSLSDTLGAGSYLLYLTEFPNEFSGTNLTTGSFLFAGDPTATGDSCNTPGGMFLASNTAPCVQRTANFSVTVDASPVPEPSTLLLVLPPATLLVGFARRRLAARA